MLEMSLQKLPESDLECEWMSEWASSLSHLHLYMCLRLSLSCMYVHMCVYACMSVCVCVCVSVRVYMHMVVQKYVHVVRVGTLVCGLPLCQCTPQSVSSLGTTYYFSKF